jgi:hypothetical protein
MSKNKRSKLSSSRVNLVDVAKEGLRIYSEEYIQQYKTQQICTVETVHSPKPIPQNTDCFPPDIMIFFLTLALVRYILGKIFHR